MGTGPAFSAPAITAGRSATTKAPPMTKASAPPDWRELGRTEWLNARHMPDRMCRIYPTQDRWSPEDEREFLTGWNEAEAADKLMRDERAPGD